MTQLSEKEILRKSMREVRGAIPPEARKKAEDDIAERLYSLPAVRNAKIIGVYQAIGPEASVNDLVRALRLLDPAPSVVYPALRGEGTMVMARVKTGEQPEFVLNPMAIIGSDQLGLYNVVDPASINLLLVPGLAFDEGCRRLGQGGGYYDRFFTHVAKDCLKVGIAFDEQIVEQVPTGVHDRRVDYVVTPTRLITPRS